MIKPRSKSKIKHSVHLKKQADQKIKGIPKDVIKKYEDKQNNVGTAKLSMTTVQSKKKLKNGGQSSSRAVSPLCFKKKSEQKTEDQKFIQKLFSQSHPHPKQKQKPSKPYLVQNLIQNLLPEQNIAIPKGHHQTSHHNHSQSTDLTKQLHIKNQEVATLQQQIQQLKLYISNFTFKVFDLTVLCRKYSHCVGNQEDNFEFSRKTDQVIAYLDSLVRHWRLEEKIKLHCQNMSKKLVMLTRNKSQEGRKRCHTQSLKIPIQDYLQSLQNTGKDNLDIKIQECKNEGDEQSEQIMKILSRRSSGVKKEEEETYVVIKNHVAQSEHQLSLKVGDRVSVLQKTNQRWLGFKQGKIGYFPKDSLF